MLRTGQLLHPASTPASQPKPGASLPRTLASPRTGLAPAGHRELPLGYVMTAPLRSSVRAAGRTWIRTDWRLYVDGRDKTKLVDALDWQIAAVEKVLSGEEVPIHAVLCFVGANWGLFSKPFQQAGVWVTWVSKFADMILEPGPFDEDAVQAIATRLARALPAK